MDDQEAVKENPIESFAGYVKDALEIVQLKTHAIDDAAGDHNAFTMGLVVIALAGVATSIGTYRPFGLIAFPVFAIVSAFISAGVFHLLATQAFKAEGDFLAFFRPFSLPHILLWVNVIPGLNMLLLFWLAWFWLLVVTVVVLERVYTLDRAKAIATVAIPTVAMFVVVVVFGALLVSLLYLVGVRAT